MVFFELADKEGEEEKRLANEKPPPPITKDPGTT